MQRTTDISSPGVNKIPSATAVFCQEMQNEDSVSKTKGWFDEVN